MRRNETEAAQIEIVRNYKRGKKARADGVVKRIQR